ncbi:larval cuticle protein 65Ab1-like [Musca autumnalis]|uniref:larval cuticle protein 65Ab1-like n=1 Tax=Musca autumnalis TaxID=221902 RepID=UPI003CF4A539
MKFFILLVTLFTIALAAPAPEHEEHHEPVEIVKLDADFKEDGYAFIAETSDGFSRHEEGKLKEFPADELAPEGRNVIVVHGTYSYTDPQDGKVYTINYVADEKGFQPIGDHIPKI